MPTTVLSNRYELGRVLGRGGMAEVREARDVILGRRVAVKILHPALSDAADFVERFRREATASAALNHPSMVAIYDAGSDGDTRYLVMEYLDGKTLAEVLRDEGRLELSRVLAVGTAVAGALDAVHRAGLVHRDVKPANIMISSGHGVKLMDLGIASGADAVSLTATSTVIGTAAYISPEQAKGQVADTRSDLYSLGCVLFESATGRPAFQGDSAVAVALQHLSADPPVPSRLVKGLPPEFDTVVARALAKEPARRHATALELSEDLQRLQHGLPLVSRSDAPDAPTQEIATADNPAVHPRPRRGDRGKDRSQPDHRRPGRVALWLFAAIVLVAVAAGVGVVAGLFDTDGTDTTAPGGETTAPNGDGETEGSGEETTPGAQEPDGEDMPPTTEEPEHDFSDLQDAVAAMRSEADQALADGDLDQSARDNLVDKAADAAEKARAGDDDALDQVESLRDDLGALRDSDDLSQPTFNQLRRALDQLERAITALL